ncbi:MAG: metal-dependent transcriptional regulator [Bacteroidia bacterium]
MSLKITIIATMYSFTEENYIKTIFLLQEKQKESINTNAIAQMLQTKASSVTDMLKKLSNKKLLTYKKYKGVELTENGKKIALETVRKHRLWETFLYEKLKFTWDEVHDIAEQLEHIKSEKLTDRLDAFLGYPSFDPHGDPIPDKEGCFKQNSFVPLTDNININKKNIVCGVLEHSTQFLKHLKNVGINLGSTIKINKKNIYDNSLDVLVDDLKELSLSFKVASNILVK